MALTSAIVLGLIFEWFFWQHNNGVFFAYFLISYILLCEIARLIVSREDGRFWDYLIILIVIGITAGIQFSFLDKYLGVIGGKKHYIFSAAVQQFVFFCLIPEWSRKITKEICVWGITVIFFVIIHFPNWKLSAITFVAAIIFMITYRKLGKWAFPITVTLHYICGSMAGKIIGTLRVGPELLKYLNKGAN